MANIFLIIAGIFGLLIGSFLNVLIYRLPIMLEAKKEISQKWKIFNLFLPRSHCPDCLELISWFCNIPLLSFFLLRGRCRACGLKISWRYPLVELMSALIAFYIAYNFGCSWTTLALMIFSWGLITLFFIDLEKQILPDQITIGLLWLGLLFSACGFFVLPKDAIFGVIVGYVILWAVAKLFYFFRHVEGLGHGDFKLLAAIGAFVGWQMLPLVLIIASLLGSIFGITLVLLKRQNFKQPIPFGPYLAIAGWIALFWGNTLVNWYLAWV